MAAIVRTTYAVTVAAVLIVVGLTWDISWHRSVGRDTFWTAPHLVEYIAAIIVAVFCGSLILKSSFSNSADRDHMVRFWGFRGPLGAWLAVWGSLAMLVSAPFDNWWHNAYGLDVKIVSPPHVVLGLGMLAIVVGAMLMTLAVQNREDVGGKWRFLLLFAVTSAVVMQIKMTMSFEYTGFPNLWRGRLFYLVSGASVPLLLAAVMRSGRLRWPATTMTALFMLLSLALSWTLQSVPATPKLAPINNPITHLVAAPFPVALIVPGFAFDLVHRWWGDRRDWRLTVMLGVVFVLALLAVSWPLSGFLLSPAARNPVFLADQWDYNARLGPWRYEYWDALRGGRGFFQAGGVPMVKTLLFAALLASASSRIGLWWGNWMRRVKR